MSMARAEFQSDPLSALLDSMDHETREKILTELRKIYDALPDKMFAPVQGVQRAFLGGFLIPIEPKKGSFYHMQTIFSLNPGDRDVLLECLGLSVEESGSFYNLFATVNSPNPQDNTKARIIGRL